jgi:acetyltransferase-like isoleucine patch superfamily enzyme
MSENFRKILREIKKAFLRKNPWEGLLFLLKNIPFWSRGQMIFASPRAIIRHPKNIRVEGALYIDLSYTGFLHEGDRSFLNINGEMVVYGDVTIGKGSRFDIGSGAICTLNNCKISGMSNFIIQHGLTIEDNSRIAWGCELLDNDQHVSVHADGSERKYTGITIQKNVWVGSRVLILKNVTIGEGSIIGAGAVVTRSIPERVLAAGNPARVIRENVTWQS